MNLKRLKTVIKEEFFKKVRFKALIFGSLVDFILSTLVSFGLGVIFALSIPRHIPPTPEMVENLYFTFIHQNSGILFGVAFFGLMATAIGSFVAAYVAKEGKILNGGLIGVMSFLSTILFFDSRVPLWYEMVNLIFVLPVAFGTSYFVRDISNERKEDQFNSDNRILLHGEGSTKTSETESQEVFKKAS